MGAPSLCTRVSVVGAVPAGANEESDRIAGLLDQILGELRQLRKVIESQPQSRVQQPAIVKVEVGTAPRLGSENAPLTIVEFTDFQCPFCRQFHERTFQDLKRLFIDTGKVRFYSLDLPIEKHPNALLAAQAGRCAAEQGKFWAMHDQMQSNPDKLGLTDLIDYAHGFGLEVAAFRQCVESDKYKDDVQRAVIDAKSKGVVGTPTFVIGKSTPDGVEGELVVGALPLGIFQRKLAAAQQ